jgi:hypothetical protein
MDCQSGEQKLFRIVQERVAPIDQGMQCLLSRSLCQVGAASAGLRRGAHARGDARGALCDPHHWPRHDATGVIATDLFRRTDVWLVDIGLEASLEEGAMMATRLYAPEQFS